MEVHIDPKQNWPKNKMATKNTKLIIAHTFFKLEDQNFEWKLILTLCKKISQKQDGRQKQNGCQNTKLIITHSNFKLGFPDFVW